MITPITPSQYSLLRSNNQAVRLALAVFRPNIIEQTTLASVPSGGNWPLSITVSGGTLTSIQRGTLIYIGTEAGKRDVGAVVARGAASGLTIPIYPAAGIPWAAGLHISVTDEIELKGSRINTGTTLITLDYGTAWTSNYSAMSPIPIMGGDVVVRVGEAFEKHSAAYHPLGTAIASYSWASSGATITGAATNHPTISYAARGNYRLDLTVTAGSIASTGFRRVLVWDDESPDIYPVRLTGGITASLYDGGHSCRAKIAGTGVFTGGERVALFAVSEYYGGQRQSMGQVAGSENIILSGWVDNITEYRDEKEAWTEFDLLGWQRKLQTRNQQYIVERTLAAETNYLQIKNPTLRSLLWHIGMVQSNAGEVMDIWADVAVVPQIEYGRAQIMAQLQDMAGLVSGTAGVDRYGRLFLTRDADINTSAPVIMAIDGQDVAAAYSRKTETNIERAVIVSAQCVPPFATANNVYSISPGNAHNAGDIVNIDGLAVSSQAELNVIAGRYYGRYNRLVEVSLEMKQNNRLVDLFPAQILTWQGSQYVPQSLDWAYNNETGVSSVAITALRINPSGLAETMTVPVADEEGDDVVEVELPGMPGEFPVDVGMPIPEHPMPTDPTEEINPMTGAIFLLTSGGLYYALDINNPLSPTWQKAGGVSITDMATISVLQDTVYIAGQYYVLAAKRDSMILEYKFTPRQIIAEYGFSIFPHVDGPLPGATVCSFGVNRLANEIVMLVGRRFGGNRGDVWVNFEKKRELNNPSVESSGFIGEFVENVGYVTSYPYNDQTLVVTFDGGYVEKTVTNTGLNGKYYALTFSGLMYFLTQGEQRVSTSPDGVNFTDLNIFAYSLSVTTGLIVFVRAQFHELHKSTDGGLTSSPVTVPSGFEPRQVYAYDPNNWVVSGYLDTLGVRFVALYKTDDGGTTWWPLYGALAEQTENQTITHMKVVP